MSKDTSQILRENIPQISLNVRKKKKKKKKTKSEFNCLTKENMSTDITINRNKTKQITANEDFNVSHVSNASTLSNIMGHESIDNTSISTATSTESKYTYLTVNYEFHEANHAIIDTFAVSLDFLRNDDKIVYCFICDITFQMQNSHVRKHLCKHIRSKNHVHLLSTMIEDDKRSRNNGKFFSKLALAREYIINSGDCYKCLLCDNKKLYCIIRKNEQLSEHIANNAHKDAKISWEMPVKDVLQYIHKRFQSPYNAKRYCCEFCYYLSPSEYYFLKHLHVPYHMTRLMEIPDHVNKFKFYFCNICLTLWFGNVETSSQHCEQIQHKHSIIYGPDINDFPQQLIPYLTKAELNAEILLRHSNLACHDVTKFGVLHSFETYLGKYIPNIKAYAFGSRISDLGFPESDIDVFLDCNNMYEGKDSSYHRSQNLIVSIVQYLSYNRKLWTVHNVILHSRTPIAKVQHIPSMLTCDISVTNGLAVENTKMIKCFNHVFPPCRKLILFLKRWLHLSGLLGSHLITSYALAWCVIFYLQTLLVFPCISNLIKLKNKSWLISGWEVGVSYDFHVNGLNHTFEELLLGFFLFYANFKYKKQIICPLLGRPIPKCAFTKLPDLPQDMAPYIAYMTATNTQECPQAFSISPLCVQDPFDLSHNLTKAVNNKKLKTFSNNCALSAKILKKTLPNLKSPCIPCFD